MENRVTDILKNLRDKKEIPIKQYKDLSPSGSRPGIMYGSAKVNKIVTGGFPSFRPILSAIGTTTYKLPKLLAPMLEPQQLMSTLLGTPLHLQKNFKVLILNLSWPAFIYSQSLPTFLCKKQLTSALKIYLKIGLMLIICQKTVSVSSLLVSCLNH